MSPSTVPFQQPYSETSKEGQLRMGTAEPGLPLTYNPQMMENLPSSLTGSLAALGPESPEFCRIVLTASESHAIGDALASFKALEIDGQDICQDSFPLPADLRIKLAAAAWDIHNGRGLCQIQGLDPVLYSDEDNLLIYLGMSSYIGDKRGIQDKKGNVISHITDSKAWKVPYEQRHGVHTNQLLSWHCDMGTDILALQVRQVAAKGGEIMVASFWHIYNTLAAEHPAVLQALAEPNWPVQAPGRKSKHNLAPLIAFENKRLLVNFDPSRLGPHPAMKQRHGTRSKPIPELTEAQLEVLAVLSSVAEESAVELQTKAGDLLYINNWALVHARNAYTDNGDAAEGSGEHACRRHLLRLWLRNSALGWDIPDSMRAPWEAAFGYTDEGYVSGDHRGAASLLKYPVMPESDYVPARYASGSAAFVLEDSESEDDEE